MENIGNMVTGDIIKYFMEDFAEIYESEIHVKIGTLDTWVGLIDGTFIGIVRPKGQI